MDLASKNHMHGFIGKNVALVPLFFGPRSFAHLSLFSSFFSLFFFKFVVTSICRLALAVWLPGPLFGNEEKPAGHPCFNAVKLAREHKKSRCWSRSHHVSQKLKIGNCRIRPRSGRKSGAPKAPEPSVGLGFRVRVSVRASHGQNTSCVGIFAYLLKNSSFCPADFSSLPNKPPLDPA